MLRVPFQDLAQYTKRRIIDNDITLLIFVFLIVSARIERPHKLRSFHVVFICHPVSNRIINLVRCVTVVRRFRLLEFIQKVVIFVIALLA